MFNFIIRPDPFGRPDPPDQIEAINEAIKKIIEIVVAC